MRPPADKSACGCTSGIYASAGPRPENTPRLLDKYSVKTSLRRVLAPATQSGQKLALFRQIWANLDKDYQVLSSLVQIWPDLTKICQVLADFGGRCVKSTQKMLLGECSE